MKDFPSFLINAAAIGQHACAWAYMSITLRAMNDPDNYSNRPLLIAACLFLSAIHTRMYASKP